MKTVLLSLFAPLLALPAWAAEGYRVYDRDADAQADVAAALARVQGTDRRVLVSLGANWCHDSRGLAEHFARPELTDALSPFEVVYVDVARRTRNQDLAARWGLLDAERGEQVGTPNLVVLDASGARLNTVADARAWRRADSFAVEEVSAWLETWSPVPVSPLPNVWTREECLELGLETDPALCDGYYRSATPRPSER